MSWKARYRQASFRGVPFYVEEATNTFGRRLAMHEYPGRDKPYPEDLGRRKREYSLTAYVIGTDYMPARDALIAAIERSGSGTLVHPYLGTLQVVITEAQQSESTRQGGMATFGLSFVEAGENAFPSAAVSTQQIVETAALAALSQAQAQFATDFTIALSPAWVTDSANTAMAALGDAMDQALGSQLSGPAAIAYKAAKDVIISGDTTVLQDPEEMARTVAKGIGSMAGFV